MSELGRLLAVAQEAVDLACEVVTGMRPGLITAKGDRDMASEVDYTVERKLRAFLAERTPDIGFLGEEEGGTHTGERPVWVLDPVDGTANFVRGLPLCGISLGLLDGEHGVLGVIDLPFLRTRFTAVKDGGACRNGTPIHVSATRAISDAIVAVGDYSVGDQATQRNAAELELTARLAGSVQRVRMFGTAATDLAWLAAGHIDAAIALSNEPWDMTAGTIIAREAGAHITDANGTNHTHSSTETIASNTHLHAQILNLTTP